MTDEERVDLISAAYVAYDSDPRVSGIDDMYAFFDAVAPLVRNVAVSAQAVPEDRNGRKTLHIAFYPMSEPAEAKRVELMQSAMRVGVFTAPPPKLDHCPIGQNWT